MAVIINEMEVIVEPPSRADAPAASATPAPAGAPPALQPHDLEDVLERKRKYELRIAAH